MADVTADEVLDCLGNILSLNSSLKPTLLAVIKVIKSFLDIKKQLQSLKKLASQSAIQFLEPVLDQYETTMNSTASLFDSILGSVSDISCGALDDVMGGLKDKFSSVNPEYKALKEELYSLFSEEINIDVEIDSLDKTIARLNRIAQYIEKYVP